MQNTELIKRQSVIDMAAAYEMAVQNIKTSDELLKTASERLQLAFGGRSGFNVCGRFTGSLKADEALSELKVDAWRAICQQMEIPRMMSNKRREELEKAINAGTLPDITADNIFATCQGMLDNIHDYLNEAVAEVFDFLRPPGSKYKTNTEFEIGHKAILGYMIDQNPWNSKPSPGYRSDQKMRNLDNVFSLLDGKGAIETWGGGIYDAIQSMERYGEIKETPYFKLKACKNGNLHIEFKRTDLVRKLNEVAGGNRLKTAAS